MADDIRDITGAGSQEAARIHEVVREIAQPEGFGTFHIRYGEDSTGDPAVWVWIMLRPDQPTDKDSIGTLVSLRNRVKAALLDAGIQRIPYIRFDDRPPA